LETNALGAGIGGAQRLFFQEQQMHQARRSMSRLFLCAIVMLAATVVAAPVRAEILVKNGEKIAFLGDSITEMGARPGGYVRLVIAGLESAGVNATAIPAGISGHKSNDMLERVDRDVISKKPDWMTLSCGVNDVWHGAKGVPLDQYKKNITEIVNKCQAANIKVMILTSTMIGEDQGNENNKKLLAYNAFLHELAKEKNFPIADLNADMQATVKSLQGGAGKPNMLTGDGVHMNVAGNQMMASGILTAFGLNEAQLSKAREQWMDIPDGAGLNLHVALTARQFDAITRLAKERNVSVDDLLKAEMKKSVDDLVKSAPVEKK
jgi:lysophospholipase L1-like esterase